MHVLKLDPETGEAETCSEEGITQDDLRRVDDSTLDIFLWNESSKRFERAAVGSRPDDPELLQPIWSPV